MGNKTSVAYTQEVLESYKIATVSKSSEDDAPLYDLFLSTVGKPEEAFNSSDFKEIFAMPKDAYKEASKSGKYTCDFHTDFDSFICVSLILISLSPMDLGEIKQIFLFTSPWRH